MTFRELSYSLLTNKTVAEADELLELVCKMSGRDPDAQVTPEYAESMRATFAKLYAVTQASPLFDRVLRETVLKAVSDHVVKQN